MSYDYEAQRKASATLRRYTTQLREARATLASAERNIAARLTAGREPAPYWLREEQRAIAAIERLEPIVARWKATVLDGVRS